MFMDREQRIEIVNRELRKAKAYKPAETPGKGRFGKPAKGVNYLAEKNEYIKALTVYAVETARGFEPSTAWQERNLGWSFDGAPDKDNIPTEPETLAEAQEWDRRKAYFVRQGFSGKDAARKAWAAQGF